MPQGRVGYAVASIEHMGLDEMEKAQVAEITWSRYHCSGVQEMFWGDQLAGIALCHSWLYEGLFHVYEFFSN